MHQSAQFPSGGFQHAMRSPEPTTHLRNPHGASVDQAAVRSFASAEGLNLPYVDPQARFSISYVPGMSEHVVNTGKTLPEAQLKVVLLACEVERLNTLNYNLVKENEILKTQVKKSEREEDLETKLAIVLAENEKLNQIVEELHTVYARERGSLSNEDYERRIAELLQDLEEWKHKYNTLEVSSNPQAIEVHRLNEALARERDSLKEQLGRQDRDLQALRARLSAIQIGPANTKQLQDQASSALIENDTLRKELETMKLKHGNADDLQQRLGQYDSRVRTLLAENDKLNNLLAERIRGDNGKASNPNIRELNQVRIPQSEGKRNAGVPSQSASQVQSPTKSFVGVANQTDPSRYKELVDRIVVENDRLNNLILQLSTENEALRQQSRTGTRNDNQTVLQIQSLLDENKKLNDVLHENVFINEDLRRRVLELEELAASGAHTRAGENARVESLAIQTNALLDENRRLNDNLADRLREIDGFRIRVRDLEAGSLSQSALIRSKVDLLTNENDKLNDVIDHLRNDNEVLRRQVVDSAKFNQLSGQVTALLNENKRLNESLIERAAEVDRLRRRTTELEANLGAVHEMRDRVQVINAEKEHLNVLSATLRSENERLHRQVGDLNSGSLRIEQITVQLNNLLAENSRLNDALTDRYRENEGLRQKVKELEGNVAALAELRSGVSRLTSENDRLNTLVYELRSENEKLRVQAAEAGVGSAKLNTLSIQTNSLLNENTRLNEILYEKVEESAKLKKKAGEFETNVSDLRNSMTFVNSENDKLRTINEELRKQVGEYGAGAARIEQLGVQVSHLLEENNRLNGLHGIIVERTTEAEKLRLRVADLENQVRANTELRERLALVSVENERLSRQVREASESNARFQSLTLQINHLVDDNARLNDLLVEKSTQVDRLKRMVVEVEAGAAAMEELRSRVNLLVTENDRLNSLVSTLRSENERLRLQAADTSRILQLTRQIDDLIAENRRTSDLTVSQAGELERLRTKNKELEANGELRSQVAVLVSENDRLNRLALDLRAEADKYRAQAVDSAKLSQLTSQVTTLIDENVRLNNLAIERASEVEKQRKRGTELEAGSSALLNENRKLNDLLTDKVRETEDLRRRVSEVDTNALVVKDLRDKLALQSSEADRLNLLVSELRREGDANKSHIAELRAGASRYETIAGQVTGLLDENRRLNDSLTHKFRETEDLKAKVSNSEAKASDAVNLRGSMTLLSSENDGLRRQLEEHKTKAVALESDLSLRTSFYNAENERISADLRGKILLLTQENDKLNGLLQSQLSRSLTNENLTSQVHSLEVRLLDASNERERLITLLSERQREIDQLRGSASPINVTVNSANVDVLNRELESLRKAYTDKSVEVEQLRARLGNVGYGTDLRASTEGLLRENERLNNMASSQLRENEALRRRVVDLERTNYEKPRDSEARTVETGYLDVGRPTELTKRSAAGINLSPTSSRPSVSQVHGDVTQSYENRIKFLDEENQRTTALLLGRDTEIERLQRKSQEYEFLQQENERLNRLLSDKLRELDEAKTQAQRGAGDAEYRKLLDTEINNLSKKYSEDKQGLERRALDLQQRLNEFEQRHHGLSLENERLLASQEDGRKDVELWRNRYNQLEQQKAIEADHARKEAEKRYRESPSRKVEIKGIEGKAAEQVNALNDELDKLREHLNYALEELEDWRNRYTQLENHQAQEIQTLRQIIDASRVAAIEARDTQTKFSAERAAYEVQILQLQQSLNDLETQNTLLSNQNQRLSHVRNSTNQDDEDWRRKYSELHAQNTLEVGRLNSQLENLKTTGHDVKKLAIKYSAEKAADQSQIKQLKQMNDNYKSEISKLYELMDQRKEDFENLNAENQRLLQSLEGLKVEGSSPGKEGRNSERLRLLEAQIAELEAQREEYRNQAKRNSLELTKRNKELVDRLQELDVLKLKYEESTANYHALNSRLFDRLSVSNRSTVNG